MVASQTIRNAKVVIIIKCVIIFQYARIFIPRQSKLIPTIDLTLLFTVDGWEPHNNTNCKPGRGAKLSKVQNFAFENDVGDCKAECKVSKGCEGFVMNKIDTVCTNLKDINIDKCDHDPNFNFYLNGRYTLSLLDPIGLLLVFYTTCMTDPIACNNLV